MKRSRLSKKFERQSQKTLILSILGIVVVLFLLFKVGIPLLATVGGIFENGSASNATKGGNNDTGFIPSPTVDDLPSSTSKAAIQVTGSSQKDTTVYLFVNGSEIKNIKVDDIGNFSFDYTLSEGDNIIKTRAKLGNSQSDFSPSQVIAYKNSPPNLTVDSPSDGTTTKNNTISVSGKTDENVKVTVNDFWAVMDENNNYSYTLTLNQGDNQIKVIATDDAGNKTEKDLKVTYSP